MRTKPTLESLALNQVRGQFPTMQRRGFQTMVRRACYPELDGQSIGLIPDGWLVEGRVRDKDFYLSKWWLDYNEEDDEEGDTHQGITFTCIEVEDHNPMRLDKLQHYAELADLLDFCGHALHLLVFDRYGLNQREIGYLPELFVESIIEAYGRDDGFKK